MAEIAWDEWRGSFDGRPSMLIKRLSRDAFLYGSTFRHAASCEWFRLG